MKIFVCIKQVPDTEAKLKLRADGAGIESLGVKWVVNPYDEFAIEESLKIRDAHPGAQVFVLSLGPKQRIIESLRTALAMGADEAIAVNAGESLDLSCVARALSQVIQSEGGADLILTGKLAIDDNSAAVPQMLAEHLGLPHVTVVSKITLEAGKLLMERDVEGGSKEIVHVGTPCVVAANKGLNTPRYASLPGIMKAKKKSIKEIEYSSLGISDLEQKTSFVKWSAPAEKAPAKIISGDAASQAKTLVQLLRDEAKAL
jgi:electron transfer flavoprotein beta subunit